jgi:tRNA threonylcarbamoyladenosine biosynthesis protein TsaB
MRILAIDTATEACSAALLIDEALQARYLELGRGHAEHILPMVHELMAHAGIRLTDLDAIAFGRGPGAFTGVRLAASVAQGLAFGAGRPVIPVSDLRAVAQRVLDQQPQANTVLVCNDARMGEVYWGIYESGSGRLARLAGQEHVGPAASILLPACSPRALHGAGSGFQAHPDIAAGRLDAVHSQLLPRAEEIARLGALDAHAGLTFAPEEALPIYLRDDVARPAVK